MLKDDFKNTMRLRHLSRKTEKAYWGWVLRFIIFHKKQHPLKLNEKNIEEFLTILAQDCSYSTQNQALQAILFLYNQVLKKKINRLSFIVAKKSKHTAAVFSANEAVKVINNLSGDYKLIASLMFGAGLRIGEAISIRIKDIDFENNCIFIRQAKGAKDRKTLLPQSLIHLLRHQIEKAGILLNEDLLKHFSGCTMPAGLNIKYPSANKILAWQYLFAQPTYVKNMRHHMHESRMQKAFKIALIKSGVNKFASPHTLRHTFATQYLANGGSIKQLQVLLGHNSLRTTAGYTHIVDLPENNISPLDKAINHSPIIFKIAS